MPKFKDNAGREWDLALSVSTVKRVRSLAEVDLLDALSGKLLAELAGDVILLCNVLYAICEPQCRAQNVTDEQFGEGLAGQALDDAARAFTEALADFFARPDQRQVIRELAGKIDQALTAAGNLAMERLEQLDPVAIVQSLDRQGETSSG